jgi:hypothetical protein
MKKFLKKALRIVPVAVMLLLSSYGTFRLFQDILKEKTPETIEILEPRVPSLGERKMAMEASYVQTNLRDVNARMTDMLKNPENDSLYKGWLSQFDSLKTAPLAEKIAAVDSIVDAQIEYQEDKFQYGYEYWATPAQTLRSNKGDSEDISLLKYFALAQAGVDKDCRYLTSISTREDLRPESIAVTVSIAGQAGSAESRVVMTYKSDSPEVKADPEKFTLHVGANEQGVKYIIAPTKAL